jgi:hypothetical protein
MNPPDYDFIKEKSYAHQQQNLFISIAVIEIQKKKALINIFGF